MGPSAHSTSCRASIVRIEIGRIEIGRIERCCPRLEVSGMIAGTSDPTPDVTTATTHAGWRVRQPVPGTWQWRSPQHRIYLVNASGTHPIGDSEFAQMISRAVSPPQQLAS